MNLDRNRIPLVVVEGENKAASKDMRVKTCPGSNDEVGANNRHKVESL